MAETKNLFVPMPAVFGQYVLAIFVWWLRPFPDVGVCCSRGITAYCGAICQYRIAHVEGNVKRELRTKKGESGGIEQMREKVVGWHHSLSVTGSREIERGILGPPQDKQDVCVDREDRVQQGCVVCDKVIRDSRVARCVTQIPSAQRRLVYVSSTESGSKMYYKIKYAFRVVRTMTTRCGQED